MTTTPTVPIAAAPPARLACFATGKAEIARSFNSF
jgi:hypothetical protein